jgi:hypothetical protein
LITGFGGGGITNLRSSTIGAAFEFGKVEVTEIVVEDPDLKVCNFAGKGLPGPLLPNGFLANCGLTIFAERLDTFFAGLLIGFLLGFLLSLLLDDLWAFSFFPDFVAELLPDFAKEVFAFLDPDFLKNLRIATIPPEGAKIMAWPNYLPTATPASN